MKTTRIRINLLFIITSFSCSAIANSTAEDRQHQAALSLQSTETTQNAVPTAQFQNQSRAGLMLPGETPVKLLLPTSGEELPPPYGANLFAGGYETERFDGLNDDYLIAAGDKLSIWLWGAVNLSEVVTVDNQGNIFLPDIGPIKVIGTPASSINDVVTEKIRTIYKKNVSIYVNLLTATPVSVFVSGAVIRPGQYAGIASDSLLYFLKRAGGIDSERGSYRSIRIIRNGRTISRTDLYDFMREGKLVRANFKDGDVIFVDPQRPTVSVSGIVKNPFRFELEKPQVTGSTLISLSKPYPKVSHVGVMGTRKGGPFSIYLTKRAFSTFVVQDGDTLIFNDDLRAQILDIQVAGSYLGPSYYAVNKSTRLHALLAEIEVEKDLANYQSVYILRKSVALRQKEMIEQSLQRLERSVFTAPASSDGEAAIRAREAEMILTFTERARKIEPLGKVVVSENGKVANILLEQGDTIMIPPKSDLIQVGGEVIMPQALVYNPDAKIADYVAWSGGYTERANYKRPLIVRANGMIEFGRNAELQPGDQVLILPRVDEKTMQAVKDITQIIYQIAVAANVALK
ncbi:polysaccharide biosynthesis/export family protein [Grimontia hollisae]|uniref:Polysialic acid transport protein kpsD n=1 Tax=Grimontia hollisae TaxID=673 RepID=A0A377HNL9_GRIHO|nr:polysaccharide biosynthesis/export family protein [Grimontia hollisae]MDF2184450.1 polysaccharide biosynthesis/export family protein [Grimontia hollisae]STO57325.1 Polysialic acid transport protein kpsD precursor [Grimontia hollisae]